MEEQALSIAACVKSTLNSLKKSNNFTDRPTIAQFMILIDSLIDNPIELSRLSNQTLSDLGICMTSIMTSGFTKNHPSYYQWNTGKVVSAVGFYAFMKQLDHSFLLNSHYPAFIVLLHDGREYFADLFQNTVLNEREISAYNPLDLLDVFDEKQKAYDITKHFEFMLHRTCKRTGYSDESLDAWYHEIKYELDGIERRLNTENSLEFAKQMYHTLSSQFSKGVFPLCCQE